MNHLVLCPKVSEYSQMCLGVPGRVTEIDTASDPRMGKVDFGGVVKSVCLALVPDLTVGDYTLVHVGFALARLDEAAALETLATIRALGMDDESEVGGEIPHGVP